MARRRTKFSDEELLEIYAKPLQVWDNPTPSAIAKGITKPAPLPWQKNAIMWEFPLSDRIAHKNNFHLHPQDNILAFGGRGGGKTKLGVFISLFYMLSFPGCEGLCGAKTFTDAEEIVIKHYKKIFSIREAWDHPFIYHVPNSQDKDLILGIPTVGIDSFGREAMVIKESILHLFHFSDWGRLRGKEYSFAHMEEISQLDQEIVLDEISRSLRSSNSPIRTLYAATNPPKSRSHFLYNKWDLTDYMPNHRGEKFSPILCKCQYCDVCINDDSDPQEWLYDESGVCTNPECKFLSLCTVLGNTPRRYSKTSYSLDVGHKSTRNVSISCPGNEPFWRVVHTKTTDNYHLPSDFVQSIKSSQDEANFAMFTMGEIIDLGIMKAFPSFSYDANVNLGTQFEVDPTLDIYWTHDHNNRPRCSVVVQEHTPLSISDKEGDMEVEVRCIKDYALFDTEEEFLSETGKRVRGVGPEHMAQAFIKDYSDWNKKSIELGNQKTVYLHGDHTALNQKMGPFSKNEFQIIHDLLVEAGFLVEIAVKKESNKGIQIGVSDRLAITNWMMRDDKGKIRVKINKCCKYLLKSLEDTERKPLDKEPIDKSCDELARRATNLSIIHLVTHPAEALGYYLVRRFNLLKIDEGFKFVYVPGEGVMNFNNKGKTDFIEPEPQPKDDFSLLDYIKSDMPDEFDQFLDFYSQW
jgi:hypothetical protein